MVRSGELRKIVDEQRRSGEGPMVPPVEGLATKSPRKTSSSPPSAALSDSGTPEGRSSNSTQQHSSPPPVPRTSNAAQLSIDSNPSPWLDRQLQWRILGPVLRIQRWFRRVSARHAVQSAIHQRKEEHQQLWLNSNAAIVQSCWRRFKAKEKARLELDLMRRR
jgi:hypothetical protein